MFNQNDITKTFITAMDDELKAGTFQNYKQIADALGWNINSMYAVLGGKRNAPSRIILKFYDEVLPGTMAKRHGDRLQIRSYLSEFIRIQYADEIITLEAQVRTLITEFAEMKSTLTDQPLAAILMKIENSTKQIREELRKSDAYQLITKASPENFPAFFQYLESLKKEFEAEEAKEKTLAEKQPREKISYHFVTLDDTKSDKEVKNEGQSHLEQYKAKKKGPAVIKMSMDNYHKNYTPPKIINEGGEWKIEFDFRVPQSVQHLYQNKEWFTFYIPMEDFQGAEPNKAKGAMEMALDEGYNPFAPDLHFVKQQILEDTKADTEIKNQGRERPAHIKRKTGNQ